MPRGGNVSLVTVLRVATIWGRTGGVIYCVVSYSLLLNATSVRMGLTQVIYQRNALSVFGRTLNVLLTDMILPADIHPLIPATISQTGCVERALCLWRNPAYYGMG